MSEEGNKRLTWGSCDLPKVTQLLVGLGQSSLLTPSPGPVPLLKSSPTWRALQQRGRKSLSCLARRSEQTQCYKVPWGRARKPRWGRCAQGYRVSSASLGVVGWHYGHRGGLGCCWGPSCVEKRTAGANQITAQTASPLTSGPQSGNTVPDGPRHRLLISVTTHAHHSPRCQLLRGPEGQLAPRRDSLTFIPSFA